MARLPRFIRPGHPQHVIVRGNNRDPIFNADEDYRFYLPVDPLLKPEHRLTMTPDAMAGFPGTVSMPEIGFGSSLCCRRWYS